MIVTPKINAILDKALSEQDINTAEAITLLEINNESFDMYALASAANTLTRRQFGNRGRFGHNWG